ncbi:unnamed protein product, partial [Mycena citricolor]
IGSARVKMIPGTNLASIETSQSPVQIACAHGRIRRIEITPEAPNHASEGSAFKRLTGNVHHSERAFRGLTLT